MLLVNNFKTFAPPRFETHIRFSKQVNMLNAGMAYSNIRFSMSNAYDFDPLLGSTSAPGFTEMATLYRRYRVNSGKLTVMAANNETFGGMIYVTPVNADPGANTATYQAYVSNPLTRKRPIGAVSGNSTATLHLKASPTMFGGSANVEIDDSYSALVNAGPTNQIWFMIGFYNITGAQASGVSLSVDLDVDIDFYELQTPAS